jgi:hypothetical protein
MRHAGSWPNGALSGYAQTIVSVNTHIVHELVVNGDPGLLIQVLPCDLNLVPQALPAWLQALVWRDVVCGPVEALDQHREVA